MLELDGPGPNLSHHKVPAAEPEVDDSHRSVAERRSRRKIQLPKRFRDDPPEAPASLPPVSPDPSVHPNSEPIVPTDHLSKLRQILKSPRNVFGLFRQFFATEFPSHDPDAELVPQHDLSDIIEETGLLPSTGTLEFGPYPNASSFALGEWFWTTSLQKTKSDFKHLIGIITDPAFRTDDLRDTSWDQIDKQLGDSGSELDWFDEPDAGWTRTPVTIRVPFAYKINKRDRNRPDPVEPQDFVIENFYHRNIVSILKERLNSTDAHHFHLEPYKLYWQLESWTEPTRVQGEVYTSPAFIDAHNELQESPGEPGCDLPRVVVALMFASDATQLTTFGQARLWPLYMHFGNDSKYRRSKPSLHLCNHVAYFQKVSLNVGLSSFFSLHYPPSAPRQLQRFCDGTCWNKGTWWCIHGALPS